MPEARAGVSAASGVRLRRRDACSGRGTLTGEKSGGKCVKMKERKKRKDRSASSAIKNGEKRSVRGGGSGPPRRNKGGEKEEKTG